MKTDARVRYTTMVIRRSFLKLLETKPVRRITVKEICDLAEINRATFYVHYRDAFDLLEQIENELFASVYKSIAEESAVLDPELMTRRIFGVIEENADLCRILFSENGDGLFLRRILVQLRDRFTADWQQQHPQANSAQLHSLYAFVTGGAAAVIEEWVRTGMQELPLPLIRASQRAIDAWFE